MDAPVDVPVPLLNPNEPESRLAAIHAPDGTHVKRGQPLVTLETTKSSVEVEAETAGYVAGLRASVGDLLRAGDRLCWLAASRDWKPPQVERSASEPPLPEGLRLTAPALVLARATGFDLKRLPIGPLITEAQLRNLLAGVDPESEQVADRRMIVYGGGGHGKAVIEAVRAMGMHEIVGIVDDGLPGGTKVLGLPMLGGAEALAGLLAQGIRQAANAVGGIGDARSRVRVFRRLIEAGFSCPAVIHPTAFVEPSASLLPGVQVMPHAYIGSEAEIGFGAIVNTSAVVSHDCRLAAYANLSPGALLAGGVRIGESALVGMGVTVNLGVVIGDGARVGNSAVVKTDVPPGGVVRAGSVWPERLEEAR
jgi:sugar O-acyltransferase (sialic acid O-acetyltransferase NeuD family)